MLNYKIDSMRSLFTTALLTSIVLSLHAQGSWTQKANLTGAARTNPTAFSIGTKGYLFGGYDGSIWLQDLWEWDQGTNTWTQKSSMPGAGNQREGGVGFSIGTMGYITTGRNDTAAFNDLWEWNQANNTWTQKANFPGSKRSECAGFAIGTKGYVGTGYDIANRQEFYEWNQANNTWTQRTNFPGNARNSAFGVTCNGKGYMGSGVAGANVWQDTYEWNASTNTWTYSGMYPALMYKSAAFALNGIVYVGTGIDDNSVSYQTFYFMDPTTGLWGAETSLTGTQRYDAAGFSIGNRGYVATGYDGWVTNDLWEFTPPPTSVNSISINPVSLYPNPATTEITIQTAPGGVIELFNIEGKLIKTDKLNSSTTKIAVEDLDRGIYFYKIFSEKKTSFGKLVLN